jgi:hypothetical protein
MLPIVRLFEEAREVGKGEENDKERIILKYTASV